MTSQGVRKEMWTEERIEQLKTMWSRGASATEIARDLGASRNAVLGKIHRMRRGENGAPAWSDSRAGARREIVRERERQHAKRLHGAARTGEKNGAEKRVAKTRPVAGGGWTPMSIGTGITTGPVEADLATLRSAAWQALPGREALATRAPAAGQCNWPLGDPLAPDFMFCGCPTGDTSGFSPFLRRYCPAHRRLAVAPPAPRKVETPDSMIGLRKPGVAA